MDLIRMKHADKNANASFIVERDDTGAALVPIDQVGVAQSHGWYVSHREHDPEAQEPEEAPSEEAPQAKRPRERLRTKG